MTYRSRGWRIFQWAVAAISTLSALRLYDVQELMAAFIIFAFLLACLALVVLAVALLGDVVETAVLCAGTNISALGRAVQRSWKSAEATPIGQQPVVSGAIHARQSNHQ
jgi:hypothetical protein